MKERLNLFAQKLTALRSSISNLQKEAEEIRSYYKHQNEETRSSSEGFIISYSSLDGEVDYVLDCVNDLIDYEENLECDCEED
jgi:hypothetical protein